MPRADQNSGMATALNAPSTSPRLAMLDAARVFAGLGVIWFHSIESDTLQPAGILGRFSVAFYTLAAMLFMVESLRRKPARTWRQYATERLTRLYLPFIGWSILTQLVVWFVHHRLSPRVPLPELSLDVLVTGTALPMWFIPFILVGCLALFPLAKWMIRNRYRQYTVAVLAILLALNLDISDWYDPPLQGIPLLGPLLLASWHRWSALYWGLALAILYHGWLKRPDIARRMALLGLLMLVAITAYQWVHGMHPALKVLTGLSFILVALAPWQHALITWVARLAPLTMGVYLCHWLWISLARGLADFYDIPICPQRDVVIFLLASLLSVTSLWLLVRVRWGAWLTGHLHPQVRGHRAPAHAATS
ncbi:MAG: acyltransferase [Phycisphaeraceae bacterium]|nr:acyltransferase [Phycisphaeraceae bacterium]